MVRPFPHGESWAPVAAMLEPDEVPIPGVRGLDHTADVGLEIHAPDLGALFCRAAQGFIWLVLERRVEAPPGAATRNEEVEIRSVDLAEEDLSTLLRSWLRTVLLWQEMEEFVFMDARLAILPTPICGSPDGLAFGLKGEVEGCMDRGPRVREIKGVTLHGLVVESQGGGWFGSVIFDV